VLSEDCTRFAKLALWNAMSGLPASGAKAIVLDNRSQRPWRGLAISNKYGDSNHLGHEG